MSNDAFGIAILDILYDRSSLRFLSFKRRSSLLLNIKSRSFSSIHIQASFSSILLAFLSWWSSATFGDGINIEGFETIANSESVKAPLRAIIISDVK